MENVNQVSLVRREQRGETTSKALNAIPGIVTEPRKNAIKLRKAMPAQFSIFLRAKNWFSCTGSQEPLQRTKQYTTANQ